MSVELGVAIIALLVSLVSFEVNRRAAAAAERHGRMPILNPQPYRESDGGRATGRLLVKNIGNGPALNIVLADATGELATEDVRLIRLSASKHGNHWKTIGICARYRQGANAVIHGNTKVLWGSPIPMRSVALILC